MESEVLTIYQTTSSVRCAWGNFSLQWKDNEYASNMKGKYYHAHKKNQIAVKFK